MSIEWSELELAAPNADGYAPTARPITELIASALKDRKEKRPAVVWIRDALAEKANQTVEECFADERVSLTLRRFHCLRAVTKSVPDPRLELDLLRRAPILYFYDPAGRIVQTLEGKRATSRPGIELRVRKLWELSYSKPLRNFLRQMDDILDRTENLDRLRARIDGKSFLLKDQPRRLAALRKKERQLAAMAKRIAEDQRRIDQACPLRERFRPPEKPEGAGKH